MMKKCWILLLISLTIGITACKTVPTKEPFYDIVQPPSRPTLVQLTDEPMKGLVQNLNILMAYGQRWEAWFEQYKAYEDL